MKFLEKKVKTFYIKPIQTEFDTIDTIINEFIKKENGSLCDVSISKISIGIEEFLVYTVIYES